ncbi:MAG: phenylalanine--tRNA ligase subunit alpha [Phycisphaerae bacterium]|nr:phenylalanine--tRNA ligase subunit alpha [Phycisphaerae bacterium]
MTDTLDQIERDAHAALEAAADGAALEAWRIAFIGPKGRVKAALGATRDVPADQRAAYGKRVNALAADLEARFRQKQGAVGGAPRPASGPRVDVTEPGLVESHGLGRRHIVLRVRDELCDVFARMGFNVAQGPEVEDDEHNFVKLNIPADHPARDPADNFYVDDPARAQRPRMLRSQTSTVQIRIMEQASAAARGNPAAVGGLAAPIRIVAPGRVYRPDTVDATHSFMFHQIEGLAVDRGTTMAELKSTLLHFARAYFGPETEVRLRPSFFPFTEPSAEFDMKIRLRPDQPVRWMELGGCGMVHPNVLRACGIDPEVWTGFAFGFGIERLAMGKYGIPDIRMLYENDLRFLKQI